MSEFIPSAEQRPAIEDRDQDILVSASAGSGKTAVLVQRVLGLLAKDHLNIDQLLMVTFTKEAAKNMRERLRKKLLASPDQHMREQISRLALADISTFDSFCEKLVRRYYYVIDLDPAYRLVTDAEESLLKDQAWHQVVNDWLGGEQRQRYLRLADNFNVRPLDDKLAQIVQALDREANAQSLPNQWLAGLLANYQLQPEQEITTTPYFQTLLKPLLTTQLRPVVVQLQALAEQTGLEKLQAILDIALPRLMTMMATGEVSGTWAELQQATDESAWGANPRKTKQWTDQDLADVATFKALRQQIKELHQTYLAASATQVKTLLTVGQTLLTDLIAITKDYRSAYQQAKARRQMLDFGDLEHYAFAILTGRNRLTQELDPAKQAIAQKVRQELQQHYRELMIDEYQDTNRLQADLLAQIHNEAFNHYFMVGDMKQSIYRFRQADPTLFLENYQAYQDGQAQHEALDLSDNYRSMTNVTDFTNLVFKQLMDQALGEMDYDQKAALTPKAQWKLADETQVQPTPVEMLVYNQQTGDELDDRAGEVKMIATRIKQMLAPNSPDRIYDADRKAMRPIKAGDIAILARTKVLNQAISEQFSQEGIPVTMHGIENYFKATEVRTMLSLLRVLDNPYQDVPLVATMRAPLFKYQAAEQPVTFGFVEPELAQLRLLAPTGNFYQVLQTVATMTVPKERRALQAKVQAFLRFLTTLQHQAQQQSLVELIWNIYQQTGYLEYVGGMPGGVQRQANLHALYERAGAYEESSFKGLYQFIQFIEKMQRNDDDLGVAAVEKDPNTVNVMTIHGSKGLQFPIVFVVHTTGQFRNEAADFVVAAKDGVGFTVRTNLHAQVPALPDAEVDYPVPQLAAIKEIKKRQSRAEEMRLLYVALTRAEQRLIITGVVKDNWKAYQKTWGQAAVTTMTKLSLETRLAGKSMFDWLGMTLIRQADFPGNLLEELALEEKPVVIGLGAAQVKWQVYQQAQLAVEAPEQAAVIKPAAEQGELTGPQMDELTRWLTFTYPNRAATETTAFQSVSTIRDAFKTTDPDDLAMGRLNLAPQQLSPRGIYQPTEMASPQFLQADDHVTAAAVGTATHLVFEKIDLTQGKVDEELVEATIKQLVAARLIPSATIAAKIDVPGIVAFYQTELGQQILQHPEQVYREVPFSLLLPGEQLFESLQPTDGPVLVHGIIDGYLATPTGWQLFDYKTDHRLSVDQLKDKYAGQLALYQQALASMMQVAPSQIQTGLYSVEMREFLKN